MLKGIILRGYSGFYYVLADNKEYECFLRGKHRLKRQDFLPGDEVVITAVDDGQAVIEKVLPRKNKLIRPPVANVSQAILVMAVQNPMPDLQLLDRLLIMVEAEGIAPIICFNKVDLNRDIGLQLASLYSEIGYKVILTSAKQDTGIDELQDKLKNHLSVFAGPSGVGKSSLLNKIQPGLNLKTGAVGAKSKRGRHTTRFTSLIPLESGGLVADSPGFSRVYLPDLKREELGHFFPEFGEFSPFCKFNTCLHHKEPDCKVREALENGLVDEGRYNNYLTFLNEVIAKERSY